MFRPRSAIAPAIRRSVAEAPVDWDGAQGLWLAAVPADPELRAEMPVRPMIVLFQER